MFWGALSHTAGEVPAQGRQELQQVEVVPPHCPVLQAPGFCTRNVHPNTGGGSKVCTRQRDNGMSIQTQEEAPGQLNVARQSKG